MMRMLAREDSESWQAATGTFIQLEHQAQVLPIRLMWSADHLGKRQTIMLAE